MAAHACVVVELVLEAGLELTGALVAVEAGAVAVDEGSTGVSVGVVALRRVGMSVADAVSVALGRAVSVGTAVARANVP